MGKTFRKNISNGQSVSYKSLHSRKSLGRKKTYLHRRQRKEMKKVSTYGEDHTYHARHYDLVKEECFNRYRNESLIVTNKPWENINTFMYDLNPSHCHNPKKYNKNTDGDFKKMLKTCDTNRFPMNPVYRYDLEDHKRMKKVIRKQLNRRGKLGVFKNQYKQKMSKRNCINYNMTSIEDDNSSN
jgi:hypothetical protein